MAQEINRLIRELRISRRTLNKDDPEGRGAFGLARRWSLFVGLIGGILGFLSTFVAFFNAIHRTPNSVVYQIPQFTLSYKPQTQLAVFEFDVTVSNHGNEDDVIRRAFGKLERIKASPADSGSAEDTLWLSTSDFGFIDRQDNKEMFVPFSVMMAKSRDIHCVISRSVRQGRPLLLIAEGPRRLSVQLEGMNKLLNPISFCYELPNESASELFGSPKRFLNAECKH